MAINIVDLTLENKLVEDIKKLKLLTERIRTRQDVGADVVQIVTSDLTTSVTFTLTAGSHATIKNTLTPIDQLLTIWNLLRTLDGNNNPVSTFKHWPDEQDDSSHDLGDVVRWEGGKDLQDSVDATGIRVAHFIVQNNDSHTLDLRYRSKWYGIKQGVAVS